MTNLKKLIPFLGKTELNDLLNKVLASPNQVFKDVELKDLLCFLENDAIDNLFIEQLKRGQNVDCFYPFVSDETLKNIVNLYCNDKLDYAIDIKKFALYLDDDDVKMLYNYMLKK